jgi:CDP-paratose 2-epimerase
MRLLITGICGFAGSVIARELLAHQSDLHIVGLDNLIRKGSETNVEPLRALGIDVRIGDLRDRATVESLPPVDWVIDCAANPSVLAGVDGKTSSQDLLDHNLAGTIHLLEHCRRHDAGFILLSTSRVYSIEPLAGLPMEFVAGAFVPKWSALSAELKGAISNQGVRENFPTDPPVSLYGASKKCSELLALEYHATFGFPVWINRCGVLAGAGQFGRGDQGIFSYWIHSWARKKPLKYIGFDGQGHQVRDCLHPRDLVPLLAKQMYTTHLGASSLPSAAPCPGAAKNPLPSSSIGGSYSPSSPILNLSGGAASAMSLRQLSDWCTERFGPHQIASDPNPRPFDIPWLVLDAQTAKTAWDWTPLTPRDKILEEIADHAKKNPKWLDMVT